MRKYLNLSGTLKLCRLILSHHMQNCRPKVGFHEAEMCGCNPAPLFCAVVWSEHLRPEARSPKHLLQNTCLDSNWCWRSRKNRPRNFDTTERQLTSPMHPQIIWRSRQVRHQQKWVPFGRSSRKQAHRFSAKAKFSWQRAIADHTFDTSSGTAATGPDERIQPFDGDS